MATFGKATFDAVSYAASRPTYPQALFDYVFRFHGGGGESRAPRWDMAVDLGCGTGQATVELTPFKKVVGVDPSAGMVDAARRTLNRVGSSNLGSTVDAGGQPITFVQSAAERLAFLSDASVDVMISAQAGHWFDWKKMWPEAARVLRPHGTFATWTYSELRLPKYPTLTPHLTHFFQGTDPETSIGPYFQRPGRSILEGHLVAVPDPDDIIPGAFKDVTRSYFTGTHYPNLPNAQPILMRTRMTWSDIHEYLRTSSALHTFLEQHPRDADHPDGDLCTRFWKALVKGAEAQEGVGVRPEEVVEVEWPLAVILAKRV